MENEPTTKTPIPTRSGYVFSHAKYPRGTAILAVVARASSPCPTRKTAKAVVRLNTYRLGFHSLALYTLIFALPLPLSVRFFVPLCLSGQHPRSTLVETPLQIGLFFCKTKPILPKTKPMQQLLPQRFMKTNHPCPTRKNKPNQSQFSPTFFRIPASALGNTPGSLDFPNWRAVASFPPAAGCKGRGM